MHTAFPTDEGLTAVSGAVRQRAMAIEPVCRTREDYWRIESHQLSIAYPYTRNISRPAMTRSRQGRCPAKLRSLGQDTGFMFAYTLLFEHSCNRDH